MDTRLTRRGFAGAIAGAGALAAQQAGSPQPPPNPNTSAQRRGTMPEVFPFEADLVFTRRDVAPRAHPFPLTQVRLLDSRFWEAQEWNRGYMKRIEADRLIHNFRLNAG